MQIPFYGSRMAAVCKGGWGAMRGGGESRHTHIIITIKPPSKDRAEYAFSHRVTLKVRVLAIAHLERLSLAAVHIGPQNLSFLSGMEVLTTDSSLVQQAIRDLSVPVQLGEWCFVST